MPREDFAKALWPTTVVEDNNLSQTILALRRALCDTQEAPRFIATVPRRGYQFVAEVHASVAAPEPPKPASKSWPSTSLLAAYMLALVAVTAVGVRYARQPEGRPAEDSWAAVSPTPERTRNVLPRSVAVLPFQDLSPRKEDAYFAAGMHEEVLNQLARIRGLNITARTSVLRYAGATTPIDVVARELGVATVLEGSVRYAADRVRVSVRLADGVTGTELWSEAYDAALGDLFRIQADIAGRIAASLAAEITNAERSSIAAAPTDSLAAYALYLQALALYRAHGAIGVSMPLSARQSVMWRLDQALAAMARLAVRDYANARKLLEQVIATRSSGMDPMPLLLVRRNSWADPVLEQPAWRSLRARLGGPR